MSDGGQLAISRFRARSVKMRDHSPHVIETSVSTQPFHQFNEVGRAGLEPTTPCVSCKCATNCANGPRALTLPLAPVPWRSRAVAALWNRSRN
jgi:hypothetical protein